MTDETKTCPECAETCPECAETVQGAALVCRYCGYRFDGKPAPGDTSTSGAAIASFITSLIGLWIAAIPLGIHAQRQIDQSGGRKTGRGFATAGVVLGIIGMAASVIVVVAVLAASGGKTSGQAPLATPATRICTNGQSPAFNECEDETPEEKEAKAAKALENAPACKEHETTPVDGCKE